MKILAVICLIVAILSLAVGIYSRITLKPINSIEAKAFLQFTQVCLLMAITFLVMGKK